MKKLDNSIYLWPAQRQCGAKTRAGTPCKNWSIKGKRRCKFHGGLSTGPRTPEGLKKSQTARLKHGEYSAAAKAERKLKKEKRIKINSILNNVTRSTGLIRSQSANKMLDILENQIEDLTSNQISRIQKRLLSDAEKRSKY